jgi:threonyl-tRNA synthetase
MEKIPYMLVVGKREQEKGNVAVRLRTEEDLGPLQLDQFIELINAKIKRKELL